MDLEVRELTPRGRGAVSVLRLCGEGALRAIETVTGSSAIGSAAPELVRLRAGSEDLDEAIACALSASHIELHVHGSPPLVRRLLEHFRGHQGQAHPSRSLEERAADLLARAPCEAAARILLDQSEGALTRALRALPALDPAPRERAIAELLEHWRKARRALQPAEVVLAGAVNSGKSTLFNALLGERRALVDAEPGTTRDLLRERAQLGAWPVWLLDTAGERDPRMEGVAGPIEVEGRERGRRARTAADLVLWLEPCGPARARILGRPRDLDPGERFVGIETFADLDPAAGSRGAISALAEPAAARARVAELFRAALELPAEPWSPGAAVPFTAELARGIEALRGGGRADLVRRVELLIAPDVAKL